MCRLTCFAVAKQAARYRRGARILSVCCLSACIPERRNFLRRCCMWANALMAVGCISVAPSRSQSTFATICSDILVKRGGHPTGWSAAVWLRVCQLIELARATNLYNLSSHDNHQKCQNQNDDNRVRCRPGVQAAANYRINTTTCDTGGLSWDRHGPAPESTLTR